MQGSDVDVVQVMKGVKVCEDQNIDFNADEIYLTMEKEDTKQGFTELRIVHSNDESLYNISHETGGEYYVSNSLFKRLFMSNLKKNLSDCAWAMSIRQRRII